MELIQVAENKNHIKILRKGLIALIITILLVIFFFTFMLFHIFKERTIESILFTSGIILLGSIVFTFVTKVNDSIIEYIVEFVLIFVSVMFILQVIISFFIFPNKVEMSSMHPTIKDQQWILSAPYYEIERNGVYVINVGKNNTRNEEDENVNKLIIKRLLGIPGDNISFEFDMYSRFIGVTINELHYNKDNNPTITLEFLRSQLSGIDECISPKTCVIPNNYFYFIGDNYTVSQDSRTFGFFLDNQFVGRAIYKREGFLDWKKIQ